MGAGFGHAPIGLGRAPKYAPKILAGNGKRWATPGDKKPAERVFMRGSSSLKGDSDIH